MRTTVNIDEHLLARAKQRAREKGVSLGEVVEESLQVLFTMPEPRPERPALPVFSVGGLLPGIDYTSNASMLKAVESDVDVARDAGLLP